MNLVINLRKPKGITSQDAVTKVKRLLKVKKAGHAGTLDPIATGVLLVCTNEATKITGYLSDLEKGYKAVMKLGETTNTYDAEGKVIDSKTDFDIKEDAIERALEKFRGKIEQTPPMFSAIKRDGKPLYELARKGIEVERETRPVTIYSLKMLEYNPPFLEIDVACSKGTYIRSLAYDIGNELGVGAHITELERTRIGDFKVEDSCGIEEVAENTICHHDIDSSLKHLKEIILTAGDYSFLSHGGTIENLNGFSEGAFIRLKDPDGRLFGIGAVSKGRLKTERLFM